MGPGAPLLLALRDSCNFPEPGLPYYQVKRSLGSMKDRKGSRGIGGYEMDSRVSLPKSESTLQFLLTG